MTNTENEVSAKYKTKNIKTEGSVVFLITINQIRANASSRRNLMLIANRL
jgi:hypothetical protein